MYAVAVWNILDDERQKGWVNAAGSTAEIVVPIRQPIIDLLLGRVTWPTRREVWATTIVVILTSMLFGIYLYIVDVGLSSFMNWAFKTFGAA